jgi:hypothetical protein
MKRVSVTSALTVAAVLTAASAAALVNTRVLDNAEGEAVRANPVELVEPESGQGPAPSTTAPASTDPPPTAPAASTVPGASVAADAGHAVPDPVVTEHDDARPRLSAGSTFRPSAGSGPTTASTPPATTPATDPPVTGTSPLPNPSTTVPTPSTTSTSPTTSTTTSVPGHTGGSRPSTPSTTASSTTAPPDD